MFSIEMARAVTADREREVQRLLRTRTLAPRRPSTRIRALPKAAGKQAA